MKEQIVRYLANTEEGSVWKQADQILSLLKEEIKKSLLTDEEIETLIRETFPLFELNEEGEEDRKETTLRLLQAQLDKVFKALES